MGKRFKTDAGVIDLREAAEKAEAMRLAVIKARTMFVQNWAMNRAATVTGKLLGRTAVFSGYAAWKTINDKEREIADELDAHGPQPDEDSSGEE